MSEMREDIDGRRASNTIYVAHQDANGGSVCKANMGDGHCSLTADTNGETLKKFRSPNKKPLNCFSLCSPLTRNRTKSSKTRTTEHGFGVTEKYTKHNCARSRSTISRGFMGKLFTRSRSTPPEARDSNDRRTVASGDPVNHTDRTAPTALPNSSSTTPIAQCVSVTTESSSTQNLELSPALTVQSELSESTQHRASVVKSSSAILYQPVPTGPRSNSEDNDHDLRLSVERCERRLERLYGRLIWLRNTSTQTGANANIKPSHTSQSDARNRPAQSTSTTSEKDWTRAHVSETSDDNDEDLGTVEKQIVKLSRKLHHIKCQVESFSYLSWLGVIEGPQTGQVAVPGRNAPASNPQLNLIRRPDLDVRRTIGEFRRLCGSPISEKVRLELRETTFNNWPWSDAWLIRFVRQMFVDLGFVDRFDLLLSRLDLWLCDIYRRYNRVPFHNYKHAFMVTQMLYALIWCTPLTECFEQTDQMALLISGICHDLDHPGFNNAYQINAGTVLAMRYNDQSPLENHHTAMTFDILSHSEANPFEHLDTDTLKRIREGIIRCILATDMSRHNDILNQFNTVVLGDLDNAQAIDPDEGKPGWVLDKKLRDLVMMILIKVCDISNEARPIHVAGPWINRLLEEFFHQSDYEKLVGLPVAPFMDREKVTKSASQCGFIRFVILPLFESLAKLLPSTRNILIQPALDQLAHYTNMQKLEEEQEEEERQKASDDSDENENKSVVAVSNKSDTASEPECELSSSPTSMEHSMCEAEFGDVRSK